jgi:hypothetical protein
VRVFGVVSGVEVLFIDFRVRFRSSGLVAGLLVGVAMISGCGSGTGTVEGTVTGADGHVLKSGQVEVHTDKGVRIGQVETDGSYMVYSIPVGEAKMCVRPGMPPPRTDLGKPLEPGKTPEQVDAKVLQEAETLGRAVPEKYRQVNSTPLELSVKPGSNRFPVQLKR